MGKASFDVRPREVLLAALCASILAALPLRAGLLDPTQVVFGLDVASVQLPFREVLPPSEVERPRNPALGDQATNFYPYYRWIAESAARGESVLWNPMVALGLPMAGNPQAGVFDPQVALLRLGWSLGGLRGFHWTLAAVAWLRLAAAGAGAYLLARVLGLARGPSAVAGAAFGLSGYLVLWLNWPHGHVTPTLPFLLIGVELARVRGPLRAAGFALTSVVLLLAHLGGHPETAFFHGALAGVWALAVLRRERTGGLVALAGLALGTALAAFALLPFLEYLFRSQTYGERASLGGVAGTDLVAIGLVLLFFGFAAVERRRARARGARSMPLVLGVLAVVAVVLARRGVGEGTGAVLLHDLFGAPGDGRGGYRGPLAINETASGWIAAAALALALASALTPRGRMRRRGLVAVLAAVALGLCVGLPGPTDLFERLPLVGLGATARIGGTSALLLALLAADGLESASRAARVSAAGLVAAGIAAVVLAHRAPTDAPVARPEEDELLGFLTLPEPVLAHGARTVEGWIAEEVDVARVSLVASRVDGDGRPLGGVRHRVPLELVPELPPGARATAPSGARYFRTQQLFVQQLEAGHWRLDVELFRERELLLPSARRVAGVITVAHVARPRLATLVLSAAGLLLVAFGRKRSDLVVVLAVALEGLWFAEGKNPAVPEGEVFPPTRTEAILRRELGDRRFLAEPGVLPPDTGMALGLRSIDGYDGMGVATFAEFRRYAQRLGLHPLLGFNARGVDVQSPAFRLLGVGALVLAGPIDAPGFELLAAPEPDLGVERAETWIYVARDPLPHAFCVPEVVSVEELAPRLAEWDPERTATVYAGWRPREPFRSAEVRELELRNDEVTARVVLDGDGLFVLAEQDFPGWRVEVDGRPRQGIVADAVFRAVALEAGDHRVRFTYRPGSLRYGAWISVWAGLLGAAGLVALLRQSRAP